MHRFILEVAPWTLAGLGAVLALAALMIRHSGPPRCPGPSITWRAWLLPFTWLTWPCGYELTGLRLAADGSVICPECGRASQSPRETLGSRRKRLAVRWGVLLVLAGLGFRCATYARSGLWARHTPTTMLVALEHLPFSCRPACCRRQLVRRVKSIGLTPWQIGMLIPALVADLRDDPYEFNALRAMSLLQRLGQGAVPALEGALRSTDWHQRQLAASLLRDWPGYEPSDDLLRVTVEGLSDDALPYGPPGRGRTYGSLTFVSNAREGVDYLLKCGVRPEPFLEAGLDSGDAQARLLAAKLAGLQGMTRLMPKAAPVLIDALKGMGHRRESIVAAAALAEFGPAVTPWLLPMQFALDQEQKDQCMVVLDYLGMASADQRRRLRRMRLFPVREVNPWGWFERATERSEFCGLGYQ